MRTHRQWLDYKELELITPQDSQPETGSVILPALKRMASYLLTRFTQGSKLRIWQTQDHRGQIWWNVYNPATGETIQLSSEQEVRIWLEEGYYRRWVHTSDAIAYRYSQLFKPF